MNFTQTHERLRLELLRRIQRGTLSVSLLARQTGYAKAHLSNFLHSRKQLSLAALDRVLASQGLGIADLLPVSVRMLTLGSEERSSMVPLVSHAVALFDPVIRPSAIQTLVHVPAEALKPVRLRPPAGRGAWQRFVSVRIPSADARPMQPVVFPEGIVVVDRYYNSLVAHRPDRPNLYAVRQGSHLVLRYVDSLASRLVLRPHNINFPVDLIEIQEGESPDDFVTGRVALIFNEL